MKLNKNISKYMSILFISSFAILGSTSTSFAGHKNYFIKTSIDYSGFGILSEVITDNATDKKEYLEESEGYTFSPVMHYGKIVPDGTGNNGGTGNKTDYLYINFNKDRKDAVSRGQQYAELKTGDKEKGLVFSFPGLKSGNGGYRATSNDYTRATLVGDTLTIGLNKAILFMNNSSEKPLSTVQELHVLLGKLSYTSELNHKASFNIVFEKNGSKTNFELKKASKSQDGSYLIPLDGLRYEDYVKITVMSGDSKGDFSYFPYKMAKGYNSGGAMAEYVNESYVKSVDAGNENEYLSWGQLILQAMLNRDCRGVRTEEFASDVQTIIGQGLGSDLTRTIGSVRSLLGLSPMSELVLNMGARPSNYHMGVMSKDMHNIALTVYTLNLIVSLVFLGFMIIKMIHQKMLATTNIVAKTTLMEGIKDMVFVCLMLGFFAPLFEILLELNYLIVRTFSFSSEYMKSFALMGSKTLSMESMAGFIISTMFLSIDMYINFVYIVRAITVSFLFAIAPIMFVSYLWSPTQKNLVFGYLRELVGNIFMQSFHAITMTFFTGYNLTNMSTLEAIASAYCFVPITQLFRQLVIGNNGGFSEKMGGKLAGQVANMTTGMQKSTMQYKQSKEMLETQTNANLLTSGLTVAGTAVGAVIGSVVPVAGTAAGAAAGAAVGAALGGVGSAAGTYFGQKEIGKLQAEHSKEQIGVGLAELGVGLGVSSFDGIGDRMVQNGMATVQEGFRTRGQSDGRLGGAAFGMAAAAGLDAFNYGISHTRLNKGESDYFRGKMDNNITTGNGFKGFDQLDSEHIVRAENYNRNRNEVELVTKLKADDVSDKLKDVLDKFKNRNMSKEAMDEWTKLSKETGVKDIYTNDNGELRFLMDTRVSGYVGNLDVKEIPNKVSGTTTKTDRFAFDTREVKKEFID